MPPSATLHASAPSVHQKRLLWGVAGLILLLELLLLPSLLVGFPGPTRYFASLWAVRAAHTFSRRILLGSTLHALGLDNGNYLLIAALGWPVTLGLFALVTEAVLRLVRPLQNRTGLAWMAILLLTPATTGVLVVTTGDPVQIGLLGLFLLYATVLRPGKSLTLVALLCFVLGVLSTLIHEASLFFLGPALLVQAWLLRRERVDWAALAGYACGALPVLVLTLFSTEHSAPVVIAPLHFFSQTIASGLPAQLPTFRELLAQENQTRFHHGVGGLLLFLRSTVSAAWLPVLLTLFLGYALPQRRRWWRAGVALLLLNLPLWAIAYDFGRFTTYLFCSLLVLAAAAAPENDAGAVMWCEMPWLLIGTLLLLTGLTNSHTTPIYIMKGLGNDNVTFAVTVIVTAVLLYELRWWKRSCGSAGAAL